MPVVGVIPNEGVTGWADTWMLSSKAKHPNCAYKWMQYITQPKPQAQQAIYFGETPVNKKACSVMNTAREGLVRAVLGQRARELLQLDQVLEDADRRLRQRPEELHRPPGLDDGLAASQGLVGRVEAGTRDGGLPARGSPPLALAALVAPPGAADVRADLAARRRVPLRLRRRARRPSWSRASGRPTPSRARSSTPGTSTTSAPSRTRPIRTIILRTLFMASAVTVTCMLLAFPYAYFMVRVAGRRLRLVLLVATVLPLWVSYLVRVYSWRLILNPDGALNWFLNGLGLPGPEHRVHELGDVARVHLHLVPVHGAAGLRGARAGAVLVHRGVGRPRRARASRRCAG